MRGMCSAVPTLAALIVSIGMPAAVRAGGVMGGTGSYLTQSAETLSPGALRLGAYGQYTKYVVSVDPEDWDLAPQLAWAPVADLELMAALPLVRRHEGPDGTESGIGDAVLGLKYRLFPNVAALGYVSLPTGDEDRGLGAGGTSVGLAGILSVPLFAGVAADLNAGYQFSGVSGDEGDDFLFYGLGLSVPVGGRTTLFGELAGRSVWEGTGHDTVQFDVGVRHQFNERVALTLGGGRGLKGDYGPEDSRTRLFAGVHFLFGGAPAPAPVAATGTGIGSGPVAGSGAGAGAGSGAGAGPVSGAGAGTGAPSKAVGSGGTGAAGPESSPAPAPVKAAAPVVPAPVAPAAPAHTAQQLDAARKRLAAAVVLFEYDRTRLTAEGERTLKQVADDLAAYPEISFSIEGHADNRGTSSYNKTLGLRRGETVMRYLVKAGIGFERMKVSSAGEMRPKVPNKDARSRALNRRAVFTPLP